MESATEHRGESTTRQRAEAGSYPLICNTSQLLLSHFTVVACYRPSCKYLCHGFQPTLRNQGSFSFFPSLFFRSWVGKNLPAHHYHQAMSKSQEGSRASTAENYELPLEVCQYDPAPIITRLCVSLFRTLNSWKRKPKWHSVHSCSRQLCCGVGLLEGGLYYREVLRGQTVVRWVGASKSVYHIPLNSCLAVNHFFPHI